MGIRALPVLLLASAASSVAASTPTFSGDVWPILRERCVGCHQNGEIGPMPLTSYREARPWAAAIREAVLSKRMPPWHATPVAAHAFRNDRALSQHEIDVLAAWASNGAPEGQSVHETFAAANKGGWKLGKPDVVLTVPGFQVPASGQVPYSFLIFPLHFEHDTWVRAAEFRIDQRAVIHHINAFVRGPESSFLAGFPVNRIFVPTTAERGKRRTGEGLFARRQLLLGYEPGYEPSPWLDSGAKLIKAGSDVIFEMHYNPNGKPAVDHSQFALYFATEAPKDRVLAIDTLRDLDLAIPPGSDTYESRASMTLGQPVRLLSIQPHMHVRGKSMRVEAVYPDGRSEILLDVPRYDFNWQTTYSFREPLTLPAGTRLESVAGFDNSVNNKFNPDPASTVRWGDQTTEEMHIAFLELAIPAKADAESLFVAQPKMIGTGSGGLR